MAAAYAALLCLNNVVENFQNYGQHLVSLDKHIIESLLRRVGFFQEFLEVHNSNGGIKEVEILERRIRDIAHVAEDIIESYIVDHIRDVYSESKVLFLHEDLHKVLHDMDLIKKEVVVIQDDQRKSMKTQKPVDLLHVASPSRRASSSDNDSNNKTMVGCEDELIQILERLTGEGSSRQVIPIVGMGGIGKTTLAKNAYNHPFTVEYFHKRAWVTVSQEHSIQDILFSLLNEIIIVGYEKINQADTSEDKLGEKLYKKLCGVRYLIVMDDIWDVDVWEKVRMFLPSHNNNGSRIMITTRESNVANSFGSRVVKKSFLDEKESWSLFCKQVFGLIEEGCCPHQELKEIGKEIVRNCKGLPLSIVVVGGLLAKSAKMQEYWEYVAKDVNSAINSEDDGHCLKLLYLSYKHLPMYLKPCFLYFGIFREDQEIDASTLIHLWVAEGFVKPIEGKSYPEEVSEEYLKDLVDRNLLLVRKRGHCGKIETVIMHDLLHELCLREAHKENFLYIVTPNKEHYTLGSKNHRCCRPPPPTHITNCQHRRLVFREGTTLIKSEVRVQSAAAPFARSLMSDFQEDLSLCMNSFKLLRVLNVFRRPQQRELMKWEYPHFTDQEVVPIVKRYSFEDMLHLVNSRYLCFNTDLNYNFPPIHTFWNLQTLIITVKYKYNCIVPSEIWTMRQLRHLIIYDSFMLPDPPVPPAVVGHHHTDIRRDDGDDFVVLENLQTLDRVRNLMCSQEFVRRVPNIKKLFIFYSEDNIKGEECIMPAYYCLKNLCYLTKLEWLDCGFSRSSTPVRCNPNMIAFPRSLKELSLYGSNLGWEDMSTTVGGSLPHLEVLRLFNDAFVGRVWKPVEGEFQSLKFLQISGLDLEHWMVDDATHFPCLQHLVLVWMDNLVEIPLCFADTPTLRSIELYYCSDVVMASAKRIADEAESIGNEDLQVQAMCRNLVRQEELQHLASGNFTFV